jgi:glycosyltransferase involved in cell wall biosynthesis
LDQLGYFSICIPQYNRIEFLIRNLEILRKQNYRPLEIIISDDQSTDDTLIRLQKIQKDFPFPIQINVNDKNEGYDRNFRRCLELAHGDYCIILGNDDTLYHASTIGYIVSFLEAHDYPDIGYCNYIEESHPDTVIHRASVTAVHGSGIDVAMQYYHGFSYVPGVIFKKKSFDHFNTSRFDGSIYAQMYIGTRMIASGCRFFTIADPCVIKDIRDDKGNAVQESYKNRIAKDKGDFKARDGGLPQVTHVLIAALRDSSAVWDTRIIYKIIRRIYLVSFPYWIMEYKKYGGWGPAIGLIKGLYPTVNSNWEGISLWGKIRISVIYIAVSLIALLIPVSLFSHAEIRMRRWARKWA